MSLNKSASWLDQLQALADANPELSPEHLQQPDETPVDDLPLTECQKKPLWFNIERKGRAGKTVTVVGGLTLTPEQSDRLLRQLQKALGCGGSIDQDGRILLQGNRIDQAKKQLIKMGFNA